MTRYALVPVNIYVFYITYEDKTYCIPQVSPTLFGALPGCSEYTFIYKWHFYTRFVFPLLFKPDDIICGVKKKKPTRNLKPGETAICCTSLACSE